MPLSEAKAQETLVQLEMAKKMVEALRSDGCKAYDALASELDQSRARVNFLEALVSRLKGEESFKFEELRCALRAAEVEAERMKSAAGQREAELEAELRKSKYAIEELRANLMDKESELQNICEENDSLIMQLEKSKELENTKALLKDYKEREYKNVCKENEKLKLEIMEIMCELEEARAGKREAVMKCGRLSEELEAAQAANGEMEMELRRLKVQCDQWRKVTEEAASVLWGGDNGQFVRKYSPGMRWMNWNYADDDDDDLEDEDLVKKKNVNVLTRFGVLWKKPHK